jgi:hypothetical protein
LDDLDLEALDRRKIFATGPLYCCDRVAALLEHLVEDGQHLSIVELDALVDLALLDRGEHQPDHAEPGLVARLHGGLHIALDLKLEHGQAPTFRQVNLGCR